MNVEELLKDTFAAHERLAPDERAVLADVRDRVAQPSAARNVRPAAVTASVLLAAAVGVGAVVLADRIGAPHRQANVRHSASAAAPKPITPLTMPFGLGWLPHGARIIDHTVDPYGVTASTPRRATANGSYTVTTGTSTIEIAESQGALKDVSFKSGGHYLRIDGHRARESTNPGTAAGYDLFFVDDRNLLMGISIAPLNGAANTPAYFRTIGRHIASSIEFSDTATVEPTFGVGHPPAGTEIIGFNVRIRASWSSDAVPLTSYTVGDPAADPTRSVYITSNLPALTPNAKYVGVHVGRRVQGRTTSYFHNGQQLQLIVEKADHGRSVAVLGHISLAEAYRIADGLILPH